MAPITETGCYAPLRDDDIRLLKILPPGPKGPHGRVQCEIRSFKLRDNPEYIALSYTWGSPVQQTTQQTDNLSTKPVYEIYCNGPHRLSVTRNLHDFLIRARTSNWTDLFWVDAICINQEDSIDWVDITIVSEFLTVTAWTRWISKASAVPCHHPVPTLVAANKDAQQAMANNAMLYALIRFRRFGATNPRDKVYALLGIAGELVRGKSRFDPAYEQSTEDVFTQAAVQILEDSDDLLLLAHAEGDAFRKHTALPSWVPDWSCEHIVGLGVTGYQRYSAAGDIPRSLLIQESTRSLVVKGFKLDEVVLVGENKREVLEGKAFPNWLSIWNAMPEVYHTRQSRFEVFWRTLITDTGGTPPRCPAPESYGAAYVSWIKSHLREESTSLDATLRTALGVLAGAEAYQAASLKGEADHKTKDPDAPTDAEEYEVIFSHALYIRPFLTQQGYLGVGSESLMVNDSVWIIPGSRVPLVLRETGLNTCRYQVVAGAYLHGFMKGEALKTATEFSDIAIV
jgi:hypothetical protein